MKCATQLLKIFLIILLSGVSMITCRKSDDVKPGNNNNNPPGNNNNNSKTADTISSHLVFFNASKKHGTAPSGPSSSSLRISVKDTIRLYDEYKKPIKFLHDAAQNIKGVYVQIYMASNGGMASEYYDVPELTQEDESDTISIIMIGIDPEGLDAPIDAEISITPYDDKGNPIAETKRPLKIEERPEATSGPSGECGLVLPDGEHWEWEMSVINGDNGEDYKFENWPGLVFGKGGQDIDGSCCNGDSKWPEFCAGQLFHNKKLHFATYYQINFEIFIFRANGTFFRQTMEDSPVPLPAESDFCSGGSGKVKESLKHTTYDGEWTTVPANLPPDLYLLRDFDKLELRLKTTSSTGTGYGNPGGFLHNFSCGSNDMVWIQADREGGGRNLFKFYVRRKNGDPQWFKFI